VSEDATRVRRLDGTAATEALGAALATLGDDATVYLHGDLGAGKTTLVRGFLRAAGHAGAVRSPTYTLMEPYETGGRRVFHFDLYRLADPEEFEEFGGRDHFAGTAWRFVEWPERGAPLLPAADLEIDLAVEGEGRRATLRAGTARGEALLAALPTGVL
jgi:tRNA threonylcarbamoyladenosine biosynthesis protein TsaE